jgi:hypothetical protein
MSLDRLAPLLVASLDLQLVRSIRGAIAPPAQVVQRGPTPDLESQQPLQASQPALQLRSQPLQVIDVCQACSGGEANVLPPLDALPVPCPPPAAPLPAPWQTLLREKVWNRPVETPTAPEVPAADLARLYQTPQPTRGTLLDSFV